MSSEPQSVEELQRALEERSYLADARLATAVQLSLRLGKPLLLEGEAGVGKTELAKATAELLGARLIRLQCYEGIDAATALYDWDWARQMLYVRTLEAQGERREADALLDELFGPRFLVRRPLLDAIDCDDAVAPVLLIDEIDRADDEFEAFLLELLADFQVTIPEIGTITARRRPRVFLTSNRTRDLHDALRRRCLYAWVDHPAPAREAQIVRTRVPGVSARLAASATGFVASLRELDLVKAPGVAETIDWARALDELGTERLSADTVDATLGLVIKDRDDLEHVRSVGLAALVERAEREAE